MSDIYVFSPNEDDNDYSTMGLVGALVPTKCHFTTTSNGEMSIVLNHPLDEFGRYQSLVDGNLLVVPVPVIVTPEINNNKVVTTIWTYRLKDKGLLSGDAQRTLYKKKTGSGKKKVLPYGTEVTVVAEHEKPAPARWKVKTSQWGTGWVNPDGFDYVDTHVIADNSQSIQEIQAPWTWMPQIFRIIANQKTNTEVIVTARHIVYDLLKNMTYYTSKNETTKEYNLVSLADALGMYTNDDGVVSKPSGILGLCYAPHPFRAYTNVANERAGLFYQERNPIDAFFNPEDGICSKFDVGLVVDNYDLYFLHDPGTNRGIRIQYSKNMTKIDFKLDEDEVVTRVIPVGETKAGEPLYLSDAIEGRYVDSPNINAYPIVHVYKLECTDCKVGQKEKGGGTLSTAEARARMKKQAQELLESGVDQPKMTMKVDYITLGDTEEYKQFRNLENTFLWDYIIVQHGDLGIDVTARIVSVTWDVLVNRMMNVTIGSIGETLENTGITTWNIPSGFSGAKIANGTTTSGALADDIISVRHVQAESINTNALQAYSITSEKIAAGAITAEKLDVVTVTAQFANIVEAEIGKAVIGTAQIEDGSITNAKIKDAEIDVAKIKELAAYVAKIAVAEIGDATITVAQIERLSAEITEIALALIKTTQIDVAQINNLTAFVSDIVFAQIDEAVIDVAQIKNLSAVVALLARAEIEEATISSAQIHDLVASVITVSQAEISKADIDWAQVKNLITGTTILREGIGGKFFFDTLNITEANVVSITAGEVIVRGKDGKFYSFTVDESGKVVTEERKIEGDNVAENSLPGIVMIENTITARELNVSQIFASEALIGKITAATIAVGAVEGRHISADAISALNGLLDLTANESIRLTVSDMVAASQRDFIGQLLTLRFSNGTYLSEETTSTTVSAYVYVHGVDVTDDILPGCFVWERFSADTEGDAKWNAAHLGLKNFDITTLDIDFTAVIRCHVDINRSFPTFDVLTGSLYWADAPVSVGDKFFIEGEDLESSSDDYIIRDDGYIYVTGRDVSSVPTEVTMVDRTDDPMDKRLSAEIKLTMEQIVLKASQTDFNDLGRTVSEQGGKITIMSDELEQKVEKLEFDALGKLVSQNSAEISLVPGKITQEVNKIVIGGRNMLTKAGHISPIVSMSSNSKSGYGYVCQKGTNATLPKYVNLTAGILKANTEYTISFVIWGDGADTISVDVFPDTLPEKGNIAVTTTPTKIIWTFSSISADMPKATSIRFFRSSGVWLANISITDIQLEEGNKATDWSPSPFDPVQRVTATAVTITPENGLVVDQNLGGSALSTQFKATATEFGLFVKATNEAIAKGGIASDGKGYFASNRLQDLSNANRFWASVYTSDLGGVVQGGGLDFWSGKGHVGKIEAMYNTPFGASAWESITINAYAASGGVSIIDLLASLIRITGHLIPDTSNARDIGSFSAMWRTIYANNLNLGQALTLANGGTGAYDAAGARANLGVPTIAQTQDAGNITTGIVPLARGGLGTADPNIASRTIGLRCITMYTKSGVSHTTGIYYQERWTLERNNHTGTYTPWSFDAATRGVRLNDEGFYQISLNLHWEQASSEANGMALIYISNNPITVEGSTVFPSQGVLPNVGNFYQYNQAGSSTNTTASLSMCVYIPAGYYVIPYGYLSGSAKNLKEGRFSIVRIGGA